MKLFFADGDATAEFAESDFPLALGRSGAGRVILGPDADKLPAAWLTCHGGRLSMQPEGSDAGLAYDGAVPRSAIWLADGGKISLGGEAVTVAFRDGDAYLTVPLPVAVTTPAAPGDVTTPPPDDSAQFQNFGRTFSGRRADGGRFTFSRAAKIVLGSFLTLGLAVAYLLVSSPVYVRVTPAPEKMSLAGFPPPLPVFGRYLALPGSYDLTASAPGFKVLRERVSVAFGASPTFEFALQKLPGLLHVTTRPTVAATILADGKEIGKIPGDDIEIDAGPREVQIVTERYLPERRKLDIRGLGRRQAVDIELKPAWAKLTVTTTPVPAQVRMDGQPVGDTPLTFEPLQGTHDLEFVKDGWKTIKRKIEIKAGETIALVPIEMEKIDGTLDLTSDPAGATVAVDNRFRGLTPLAFPLVSDRDYTLKLTKVGYADVTRRVRVEGAKTTPLAITMPPEMGTLFVATNPPGASLAINGAARGSATQRLSLQTVPQTLTVTKQGYIPFKTTVTPQRGVSRTINVTLKTVGQDLIERDRKGVKTKGGQRIRLIFIDGTARFTVGAPRRDPGRRSNEAEYPVELRRSFWVSEKEVTNAEFRKFDPKHNSGTYQGTSLNTASQPVVNLSWDDAARYANWLSKQEGLTPAYRDDGGKLVPVLPIPNGYRLPTEAEWEFLARYDGGRRPPTQPLRFPWGDALPPPNRSGNYADDAPPRLPFAISGYIDGYPVTAPVGKFPANPAGIYDLGGNVAEWCHDYYDVTPSASSRPLRDPSGPRTGRFHVIKGAGWRSGTITDLRLSYRDYAENARDDIGFRIVRYAKIPAP